MQQLVPEQQTEHTAPETVTEQKERRSFDAVVTPVTGGFIVEMERRILRAAAGVTVDGAERALTFDEEQTQQTFTVPTADVIYRQIMVSQASPWEFLAELLPSQTPVQTGASMDHWTGMTDLTADRPRSAPMPRIITEDDDRTVRPVLHAEHTPAYNPLQVPRYDSGQGGGWEPDASHMYVVPSVPVLGRELGWMQPDTMDAPRPVPELGREQVYDAVVEQAEDRVTYRVTAADDDTTIMDTLLALNAAGELTVSIVKQPFYSAESFEDGADAFDAGWHDGFYGVAALNELDMDVTEFSTGRSVNEMSLAKDAIDRVQVDSGDYVSFTASNEYLCGVAEDDSDHRAAWMDRYGAFDAFDSATERGVYAALAEASNGAEDMFLGAPLDLARYEVARDTYVQTFGVAPEEQVENVVYAG